MKKSINTDNISFRGKGYPCRTVDIPEFGERLISTEALGEALFDKNGNYVDSAAKAIDETIFFFVPKKLITTASDEELVDYICDSL